MNTFLSTSKYVSVSKCTGLSVNMSLLVKEQVDMYIVNLCFVLNTHSDINIYTLLWIYEFFNQMLLVQFHPSHLPISR